MSLFVSQWEKSLEEGDHTTLEKLLDLGHDFNVTAALARVVGRGHLQTARFLLSRGADVNGEQGNGEQGSDAGPPLISAASEGYGELVTLLLEHNADIEQRNSRGESALHKAVTAGHSEIIQLLLEAGAQLESKNNGQQTPLHVACLHQLPAITALLLESGASCNALDRLGNTPAHAAAAREDVTAIIRTLELLISRGADLTLYNNGGDTVLDISSSRGLQDVLVWIGKSFEGDDWTGCTDSVN